MYEMIPYVLSAIIEIAGIIIIITPKSCTRKDKRNIPQEVEKVKRKGGVIIIIGLVMLLSGLL